LNAAQSSGMLQATTDGGGAKSARRTVRINGPDGAISNMESAHR
jgi:hypothetical protein